MRPSDVTHVGASRTAIYQLRLWSRVGVGNPGDCWLWTGQVFANGYGYMTVFGRKRRVHRMAYEWTKGPIPEGLQLDHLCRNRCCCNPGHLEAVTARENIVRAVPSRKPGRCHPKPGRCRNGHSLSDAIPRYDRQGGTRCRSCKNAGRRRTAAKQQEPTQ